MDVADTVERVVGEIEKLMVELDAVLGPMPESDAQEELDNAVTALSNAHYDLEAWVKDQRA